MIALLTHWDCFCGFKSQLLSHQSEHPVRPAPWPSARGLTTTVWHATRAVMSHGAAHQSTPLFKAWSVLLIHDQPKILQLDSPPRPPPHLGVVHLHGFCRPTDRFLTTAAWQTLGPVLIASYSITLLSCQMHGKVCMAIVLDWWLADLVLS